MLGEMSPAGCLFCRIASGDLAADLVEADDVVVRDIGPQAPAHVWPSRAGMLPPPTSWAGPMRLC